jgi:hypothetical protein
VAELALNHVQRHALAGHLDSMCVAKLVRGEAAADAGLRSDAAELVASGGRCPGSSARLAVDDAEQRPYRHLDPAGEPGPELLEPQLSIPTSRRLPPLP